jgi:tetratricopeptide (TPR) repeat protein
MSNNLSSTQIRAWIAMSAGREVFPGLSEGSALKIAIDVWESLLADGDIEQLRSLGDDFPDVLYALVSLLTEEQGTFETDELRTIQSIEELVEANLAAFRDETEGHHLAARFAYLAWRSRRRLGMMGELSLWEARCVAHVMAQSDARAFLSLPISERTEGLSRRFLSEPTVLLAVCGSLSKNRNCLPAKAATESEAVYSWLSKHSAALGLDDRSYFSGEIAFARAAALRHLGRYRESELWADRATTWFAQSLNPTPWCTKVEVLRAIALYDTHRHDEALNRMPQLLGDLERFEMVEDLQKCRLVHALLLKDIGEKDQSLALLKAMKAALEVRAYPLIHGLVLSNLGEVLSSKGFFSEAMASLSEAVPILIEAATPWAFANLQATIGEVLRDHGDIAGAVDAYRRAVSLYVEQGIEGKASYLRVVLAQCLVAIGRDQDATRELLVALAHFDRELVAPDALAAVALLRESVHRQKCDPEALKALRLQMKMMGEGER